MKTTIKTLALFLIAGSLVLVSCKKNVDKEQQEAAQQAVEDNANAESVFDNIFNIVDDNLSSATDDSRSMNRDANTGCPTLTIQTTDNYVSLIEIDFGDTYCTPENSSDQIKGKLIVTANGRYREEGTVITTALEDFYFNGYQIEGTKTVTNLGRDADSLINYSIVIIGGKLTAPSGEFSSWESTRNRRWLQGESSWWWPFDDVYEISGTSSGVNANGEAYNITVNDPLWVRVGCRFVQQGNLTVTTSDYTVDVDYGDYAANQCHNTVTYVVNGNSYTYNVQ
jgi:hypothetical protein